MAEPARKLEDDENQPYLRSIPNGKNLDSKITDISAIRAKQINDLENDSTKTDSKKTIQEQEESGSNITKGLWDNKVQGKKNEKEKVSGKFGFVKKKGPLTAIILTLVGGGIGIGGLLSPSMLIVHLKETMVNKFNVQLTSMDIRTKKIIHSKMTGGVCNLANIACKFSSMSQKQIDRLGKAGIEVAFDESSDIIGRHRVNGIKYNGDTIDAKDLMKKIDTDPNFRLAVKKAYNPLFAGFYDKVWNKTLFYIDKKGVHLGGKKTTDADKLTDIQKTTKEAVDIKESDIPDGKVRDLDEVDSDPEKYSYPDPDNPGQKITIPDGDIDTVKNSAKDLVDDVGKNVDEISGSSTKAVTKATNEAVDMLGDVAQGASKAASILSLTGWIDNFCTAYGTVRAIGFAAKTVRVVQLASYAMIFLKVADMIKAGVNPEPEDVEYLGKVLTTAVISTKVANGLSQTTKKTATDSFGYKYAAYGEVGVMPESASQFLAGAGLTGSLISFTSELNNVLGGTPATTCRITQNILFQIGSAAVGIAIGIATGGLSISIGAAINTVASVSLAIGVTMLPSLLQDIIAGVVVDQTTVGELAGDAITSGSSNMMGTLAKGGGNAPLTIDQAVAYNALSQEVAHEYAEEDRIAYSPLDASNSNTFMGSLVSKIIPYVTNVSSISSAVSSLSSFATGSLTSINNTPVKAASAEEYSLCQDDDYKAMGIAADPYCNIAYGIPVSSLNKSPEDVANSLANRGLIDSETGEPKGEFLDFQNDCIYREEPIGYSGQEFQADSGKKCIINSDNEDFYLYTIDKRIDDGMSGDDADLEVAYELGLDSRVAFYDGSEGINNNIASSSFFAQIIDFFKDFFAKKNTDFSYINNQIYIGKDYA